MPGEYVINGGWSGDPLHRCDICGTEWHISSLTPQVSKTHGAVLACPVCLDDLLPEQRDAIIAEVLSDGKVDADIAEKLKNPYFDQDDELR
jgi:hypothetical protein